MSVMWFFKNYYYTLLSSTADQRIEQAAENVPVVNKKDIIDQIMLNKKIILALNFLQPYV